MRDIIIHDYSGIDFDEIWGTITRDLPELKVVMQKSVADKESEGKK